MRKRVDVGSSPTGIPFLYFFPFNPSFNLIEPMKDYNRREFIKSGILTSTAFFFISPFERLFATNANNNTNPATGNQADIRQLQLQAKNFFYQKEYLKAEQIYRRLIVIQPTYIAAYDGLAKTFYAQNKSLTAAEVYRQGWLEHRDNPLFCDRLARAMKRLVAGNKKQEKEFCFRTGQADLLEASAQLYIDAIEKTKAKPRAYLAIGLLDVQRTLGKLNMSRKFKGLTELSFSTSVQNEITKRTQSEREKWNTTRKRRTRKEFDVKSEAQAQNRELKSRKKNRRELHFDNEKQSRIREQAKGKKQLYYPLFIAAIKSQSTTNAEKYHRKIVSIDKNDKNANGELIRFYRKQRAYSKLVQFQAEQYAKTPDFWTTVSYAQALRLQSKKQAQPVLCNKAIELYNGLATKTELKGKEYTCVYGGLLDCLIQQKKYAELRTTAIEALAPYPLSYMPFVLVYIKSWTKEGKLDSAEQAYNMLLNGVESTSLSGDPVYKYLQKSHKLLVQPTGKANEVKGFGVNKEQLFDLYYAVADLYKRKNNSAAERDILSRIKQIDPDNGFVKKRAV